MNFIRRLNREKFLFFKPEFSNWVANQWYGNYEKKTMFQLNISKIMPAKPKNTGMWVVNRSIFNPLPLSLTLVNLYIVILYYLSFIAHFLYIVFSYLTMDHTRKLLLVLESDPKVTTLPLVGM